MSGNRRKGQAASSSQAAGLLQAGGVSLSFLNHDAVNLLPAGFNTSGDVEKLIETIGVDVDPQLRIVFKKLTKKDVQTREKAVKELLQEVQSSKDNTEKLKNAFPCFATSYAGLVTDASTSIRATANAILSAFLTILKKDAGVYLKTVFPFLLFSTNDAYHTVATSAKTAFEEVCTTSEKRQKALDTFAGDTANICLQIMSRQHKLVQAQKTIDTENDATRQARLIAQAINALTDHLIDMFNFENPPRTPRSPGSINELNLEEQLFEPSVNEQKRLPALFRIVLSPDELNNSLKKCFITPRTPQLSLHHKLFIWDSLVQFLSELDIQTRAKYAASVDTSITDNLLALLFNALPKDLASKYKLFSFNGALSVRQILTSSLSFQSAASATTYEHYLINLFYRTTICLPSCVRAWYIGLPRNQHQEVTVYVRLLAPIIIERELNSVGIVKKDRLTVKALSTVKEIIASYRFEEAKLSLKITLPDDYPFSKPTIETERAIVNADLLRKLLRQLTAFLDKQNGLMLDGILQWKRAIDNHLEGIEDCSICMSTVSAANYTLPQLQCRECKKKFHGHCLYKWFETSNAPTCPMCRHTFYN
uniref:E3 ubiquitin-protein ligase listerin n=1 Tax=Panagrellus redivivus TaxID=6233 RepID=A0A7E4UW06_PANRE